MSAVNPVGMLVQICRIFPPFLLRKQKSRFSCEIFRFQNMRVGRGGVLPAYMFRPILHLAVSGDSDSPSPTFHLGLASGQHRSIRDRKPGGRDTQPRSSKPNHLQAHPHPHTYPGAMVWTVATFLHVLPSLGMVASLPGHSSFRLVTPLPLLCAGVGSNGSSVASLMATLAFADSLHPVPISACVSSPFTLGSPQ